MMLISVSSVREHVPKWNNNEDDENPIVAEYRAPTMALRERLIPKPKIQLKISNDGKSEGGETVVTVDNRGIVMGMLLRLRNCDYQEDGTGKVKSIVTASDLFSDTTPSEFAGLADELGLFFQQLLTKEVDTKN